MIKKINWESIGNQVESCATFEVICCVTALYLHRKITLIHDLSGLFWVVNIKSKVAIFCPIKERINHSARGEFNLSLLSLITVPKKRRGGRDSFEECGEITCGCAMRDASTCEYIALPCFRTNYRGLCALSRGTVTTDIVKYRLN